MDEQEPTSGKIQSGENKISKPRFGLLGVAGAVTVSIIAFLYVINNPISTYGGGGFGDFFSGIILYGIAFLGIPVSLVLGAVAGIATGRSFKTRIGAFISGFLVQFIIEVPVIWLIFS